TASRLTHAVIRIVREFACQLFQQAECLTNRFLGICKPTRIIKKRAQVDPSFGQEMPIGRVARGLLQQLADERNGTAIGVLGLGILAQPSTQVASATVGERDFGACLWVVVIPPSKTLIEQQAVL